jgi:hypothetical protein
MALALPETEERSHMNHPDFRVAGKIFATLGYPDKTRGMVKLSPEQQHYLSKDYPDAFVPVKGVWGRRGATHVILKAASKETLRKAIQSAWQNTAPKHLGAQEGSTESRTPDEPNRPNSSREAAARESPARQCREELGKVLESRQGRHRSLRRP